MRSAASSRLRQAESQLASAGVETPRLDAELLLASAMDASRSEVVAGLAPDPSPEQLTRFEAAVERRAAREPLAYIVGSQGFRRIELDVDGRVLIPRPETELLVAVVKVGRPCGILDVATGSGAVALALADELPDATIVASDVSAEALAVARANAGRLGFEIDFVESDLLASVDGVFDAIAANLPYVARGELAGLQPEITDYEPALALDGGEDGLDLVRALAPQ
ncbi:MAG: peptide chain release factor N(5)-glutamine methyltransferase, partial [Solirubrobacterales bacterium]